MRVGLVHDVSRSEPSVSPADTPRRHSDRELALAYVDSCGPEADRLLMAVVYALLAVEDTLGSLVYVQNGGYTV